MKNLIIFSKSKPILLIDNVGGSEVVELVNGVLAKIASNILDGNNKLLTLTLSLT